MNRSIIIYSLFLATVFLCTPVARAEEPEEMVSCSCYEKVKSFWGTESRGKELGSKKMKAAEAFAGGDVAFCKESFPGSLPGAFCVVVDQ